MKRHSTLFRRWLAGSLVLVTITGCLLPKGLDAQEPDGIEKMRQSFQNPPDDARVMMRWWWFGPAVTKEEISRELHVMKEGGIGGVEIQAVYPVALDDPAAGIKNLSFLSDEHLEALRYANDEAHELGLRVDITLGSGWPFGGPSVPIDQASGKLRVDHVKLNGGEATIKAPRLDAGEQLIATFLASSSGKSIAPDNTHLISAGPDGTVPLPPDLAGANEVLFFISSRTKQMVKRAGVGAEGYVLDHYDHAAVEAYLDHVGERLLQAFGDKPPHAVFCDSLEVYESNWTPSLLDEFKKRRGYDLTPLLPALIADFGPSTSDIRRDWAETLTDLFNDNFVRTMQKWATRHHTKLRMQAYGIPPATLSSSRTIDLPEGEGPQWKALSASRWASSANHLYGKPITSSETWTWVHSPAFRAVPMDLKAEADLHFLQGINQLVGHGWPYSAPSAPYPGWHLYAAGALSDKNPWWIVMPDLMGYLQRMSYLLRQGQPANDVAIYLPNNDAWAQVNGKQLDLLGILRKRIGDQVVVKTLEAGFNFDFFDDEALHEAGQVAAGELALGANKYKVIILPNVESIPLETLRKLDAFVRSGGQLIATHRLPGQAPGYRATEAEQKEVVETVRRLFQKTGAPASFVPDEKAGLVAKLTSLLRPDVEFSDARTNLGFIHRQTPDADFYFVANTGPETQDVKATFRAKSLGAQVWDPFTGNRVSTVAAAAPSGGTQLPLKLEPYESRVYLFPRQESPASSPIASQVPVTVPSPLDLSDHWRITFGGEPTVSLDKLNSWTDDPATLNYSGLATYEKEFDLPQSFFQSGTKIQLDFGQATSLPIKSMTNGMRAWIESPVREAAVVYMNGERAGTVWHPPYGVDVTRFVRPGANKLKIVVGNTAINAMAGSPLPDDKELNRRFGERFKPQDMDKLRPLASGMTGPVTLTLSPSPP